VGFREIGCTGHLVRNYAAYLERGDANDLYNARNERRRRRWLKSFQAGEARILIHNRSAQAVDR
jgi:hypothetical protein